MSPGSVEIDWHGTRLVLLPDRAAWMADAGILLVADVHLGKPASFRSMGVPVPEAVTGRDLERLSALLRTTRAGRLIVLGDLVHDAAATRARTRDAVRAWRDTWSGVGVDLIPGNHDRRADDCACLGVRVLGPELAIEGLRLTHEPPAPDAEKRPTLCGHLHPVVSVGPSRTPGRVRSTCFWFAGGVGILPAFGSFTGGCAMAIEADHAVFAAGDREVIPVSPLATRWAAPRPSGSGTVAYDRP